MNAVYLIHIVPARNMARFYSMSLQPTLFAECSVVREWGRIGRGGQVKATPYPTVDAAQKALEQLAAVKTRRGYLQQHSAVALQRCDDIAS